MRFGVITQMLLLGLLAGCTPLLVAPEGGSEGTVHGLSDGAIASPSSLPSMMLLTTQAPLQVAQADLTGQCRRTGRLERVYSEGNLESATVRDLDSGFSVILAGAVNQPSFGWVRISSPVNGYIQTPFLKLCDTPPQRFDCGIVTQPDLALKPTPATEPQPIGTLFFEQGFRITGRPEVQTTPPAHSGRVWVPIERFGQVGWVIETTPDAFGRNFRRVDCSTIGLEPAVG